MNHTKQKAAEQANTREEHKQASSYHRKQTKKYTETSALFALHKKAANYHMDAAYIPATLMRERAQRASKRVSRGV